MEYPLSIGSLQFDGTPRVAVVLDRLRDADTLKKLATRGADLLEIRVDLFDHPFERVREHIGEIRRSTPLPLIGTIRENQRTSSRRRELFASLIPVVDAVDVEVDAPFCAEVAAEAARLGKCVIVSEHNFQQTPPSDVLDRIIERANGSGANIVKVATMAHCREDVARILELPRRGNDNLVVIAMGAMGTVSRVVAPLFGSLFTYAPLDDAVAPGQLPLDTLVKHLRLYYPQS